MGVTTEQYRARIGVHNNVRIEQDSTRLVGYVGGTTQRNILLIPLLDPAGVGGWHCPPYPERLIANQELGRHGFIYM